MKIIKIANKTNKFEIYPLLLIDTIKDNKFCYFLYFQELGLNFDINRINNFINFLNKKVKEVSFYSYITILDGDIYTFINYYHIIPAGMLLRLAKKCKFTDKLTIEKSPYLSISITSFLNKNIRNLLIKYWNNYAFGIEVSCDIKDYENMFSIYDIWKIVEVKNNVIYREKINPYNKINNFKKELVKYLFKK